MKIAITGKGGVGKTTFAAMISRLLAEEGYSVLGVDADPDANLALALGFPKQLIDEIVPISEMKNLVAERTASTPGTFGTMFKMNPKVSDIPEQYCKEYNGVKVLTMGTVDTGGSGCVCPEHVLLKTLTSHLILGNKDVVVMDMEAGIEHLGRGTAKFVDAFIVVVEPGERSLQTYRKVKTLAEDIGVKKIFVVANKIRNEQDEKFILENVHEDECLGFIHYNPNIVDSDRSDLSPFDSNEQIKKEVQKISDKLKGAL
ncbi:CO dehydrogenase nickel-insertion accessory protein CooC [Clostridium aceticum]|uniref:CO dehydrogenase nickel-insertion accessory protein CooC n=1 Tax=Clostridium aceticum TaxID=84022 RepID=A0A0D8ID81_9CLOT|nr:carbon monoxide dehydrogenase accessory protein CooC [Clostridium aceticum]AKL94524.1 CO dehydrogenase nickel-insertion accessory protein CooC [Clostridium aceticum]KJF28270.1 carbon monoxide dehydrogenase [Clostridium aceticum]